MEDIAGNFPYLEELEGIKTKAIFLIPIILKENSDEVAKKLTYASLYEDYD